MAAVTAVAAAAESVRTSVATSTASASSLLRVDWSVVPVIMTSENETPLPAAAWTARLYLVITESVLASKAALLYARRAVKATLFSASIQVPKSQPSNWVATQ
eukprot:3241162-Rhodomonas_salina.2